MENQIPFGFQTKDDWPKWLQEANGIPEKALLETASQGSKGTHNDIFFAAQNLSQASSDDEASNSPSEAKQTDTNQCQICGPDTDDIPDEWINECGKLVLETGEVAAYGFINNLYHWDMLERKYSHNQLSRAAFVPYNKFYQTDYFSKHEPWLHCYNRILQLETRMAITLKHTSVPKIEFEAFFAPACQYLCIGYEMCNERELNTSDIHMHAYLQLKKPTRVLDIYRSVTDKFQGRCVGLPEVWKLQPCNFMKNKKEKQSMDAFHWIRLCKKDAEYLEHSKPHDDRDEFGATP
eukprot:12431439-Karenia_brevis.AAC.1